MSDDYKTRMITEYNDILTRYNKLCAFIQRVEDGSSPIHDDYPVRELYEQKAGMEKYLAALKERLKYEEEREGE